MKFSATLLGRPGPNVVYLTDNSGLTGTQTDGLTGICFPPTTRPGYPVPEDGFITSFRVNLTGTLAPGGSAQIRLLINGTIDGGTVNYAAAESGQKQGTLTIDPRTLAVGDTIDIEVTYGNDFPFGLSVMLGTEKAA